MKPITFFALILLICGCLPEEPESDVVVIEDFEDWERESPPKPTGNGGGEAFKSNLAWWGYQKNIQWLEGTEYRDNGQLRIDLFKNDRFIYFNIPISLDTNLKLPTVYNSDFMMSEEVDRLVLTLTFKDNKTGKTVRLQDEESLFIDFDLDFSLEFNTADMRRFSAGMHDFTVTLSTEFVTVFGDRSGVRPVSAQFNMPYLIPEIHETEIYFDRLELNEKETRKFLGDNDFSNADPEAGILVKYDHQRVMFEYNKNTFILDDYTKESVYHTLDYDTVEIQVLDVDYGFNSNDVISKTRKSLKNLDGPPYKDLQLYCVDELLIYAKYKRRVN